MRVPKLMRYLLLAIAYPTIYWGWVSLMKNLWIENNLKDLHPEILFPDAQRFTTIHSSHKHKRQLEDALVKKGQNDLKDIIEKRIQKKDATTSQQL